MKLSEIAVKLLHLIRDKSFFLTWTPALTDFRTLETITLHIHTKNEVVDIPILRKDINSFIGLLAASLFRNDNVIISWNIKELISHFKFFLEPHQQVLSSCEFIDLKLCESFLGIQKECPESYAEAIKRASKVCQDEKALKISQNIYRPLALQVIPAIETTGIVNTELGVRQFSCYHIEGTLNGRLSCSEAFPGCFLAHTISQEKREVFSPGDDKSFLVLDYKHMEVSVLSWLSKDKILEEIIRSQEDVYEAIYRIVSGARNCNPENRQLIKGIFLPVVFGMALDALAEKVGSVNGAKYLLETLHKKFSVAFDWVQAQQDQLKLSTTIRDCFGRVLDFGEGSGRKPYSVRNAVIQSPSALICLEKLITLYQQNYPSLAIVASIHDGYVCTVDTQSCKSIALQAKEVLESPPQLAPDLKLKVDVKAGKKWSKLHELT